jgi:uncharacterized membrane protein
MRALRRDRSRDTPDSMPLEAPGSSLMDALYLSFKFLHVAAATTWVGALVAISLHNALRFGGDDRPAVQASARASRLLATAVRHPAATVTVLAGMATMALGDFPMSLWIGWGIAAMVASGVLGATGLQRLTRQLVERSAAADRGDLQIARARTRLALLGALEILLVLSAMWAMVSKPTF